MQPTLAPSRASSELPGFEHGVQRSSIHHQAKVNKTADGVLQIEATLVTYGEVNQNGWLWIPGACQESLKSRPSERKPLVLGYQHHPFAPLQIIGRWTEARESEQGVHAAGVISDTQAGRDAATLVQDGAVTGVSVGFFPTRIQFLEPGVRYEFETPYGKRSYEPDTWAIAVLEAQVTEASIVDTPADDEARIERYMQAAIQKAGKALPGLAEDADWDGTAYSMALLMGGRGAGAFSDLPDLEHRALYERIAQAYKRHDKTPPTYERDPRYPDVTFQHDEREIFQDRFLRKSLASVVANARGASGPLSEETRHEAEKAVAELQTLLQRREEPAVLAEIVGQLNKATETLTGATQNG